MDDLFEVLVRYRYPILFGFVLAEQIGLPLPALPILLACGALIRTGQLDLAPALGLALTASVLSDLLWFELGRRKGGKVLNLLCRISLEPDSCVRRTEEVFARHGARSLLVAKFIPGFNTAAPPLAGVIGMRVPHFLLYDALGAALWLGTFLGLGYAFGDQLELVLHRATELGARLGFFLVLGLALYVAAKYWQRQRFLRELRVARITAADLQQKLDRGENVVVMDLRHRVEFEAEPESIPGAVHFPVEDFENQNPTIPEAQEIVLFCT